MRFAKDSTPGATPGTCADEWSLRARQPARFEVSTTGECGQLRMLELLEL
jgi:hypothetical protein